MEEFYDEVSRKVIPNASWGHHLDAFNDILRGDLERQMRVSCYAGKNSELSRQRLNY